MDPVLTERRDGFVLKIYPDEYPLNPLEEFEPLGTKVNMRIYNNSGKTITIPGIQSGRLPGHSPSILYWDWRYPLEPINPKAKDLQGFLDQALSPSQMRGRSVREIHYRHTKKRSGKRVKKRPLKLRLTLDLIKIKKKYWEELIFPALIKYAQTWDCGLLHIHVVKSNTHEISFYTDNHPFSVISEER